MRKILMCVLSQKGRAKNPALLIIGIAICALYCANPFGARAQGTFQDLDFESATLTPVPAGPPPTYVPISSALPGWTGYVGAVQQTQVIQNDYGYGQALIAIFGPNYPAADASPGFEPGIIDGNYSVLLQSGGDSSGNGTVVGASIAQTGTVPSGSESIEFKAWQTLSSEFTVSYNGNTLSPIALGTGANYTLYGADISSYAGQSGQLEFTADFSEGGASWLGLDDIAFSTTVVPEPSPLVLTGIGGLLLALYRRCAAKRP